MEIDKIELGYKVVEITWLDAQSGFSSPIPIEELIKERPVPTKSCGFLLHEDEYSVILGFMLFGFQGDVKHWQVIPKGMILNRTEMEEKATIQEGKR